MRELPEERAKAVAEVAITWESVRVEAAKVADKTSEILRLTDWSENGIEDHLQRIEEQCQLTDRSEGLNVLLELCLMRRYLRISEELSEELKLDITVTMWLRRWSADDFKQALSSAFARLALVPATAVNGIAALLEIAILYQRLKQPSIWPTPVERGQCAELMFLLKCDEEAVYSQMMGTLDRFGFGRGNESAAMDALREIELLRRRTAFDDDVPESYRRKLLETMWLRQWTAEEAFQYIASLRERLLLCEAGREIEIAHVISLLFGPNGSSL